MKIETLYLSETKYVQFIIGQDRNENHDILDLADDTSMWFHADNYPSCHVIAILPAGLNIDKKNKNKIIKKGALLCKTNTNSLKKTKNLNIIYTTCDCIKKTHVIGEVISKYTKIITI